MVAQKMDCVGACVAGTGPSLLSLSGLMFVDLCFADLPTETL